MLSPGYLPNPKVEPVSPAVHVDSFKVEPPGKSFLMEKQKEKKKLIDKMIKYKIPYGNN